MRQNRRRGPLFEPLESLEPRYLLSSSVLPANLPITSNSSVQQDPSIAADPLNPKHLVVSYMDYSLVNTGYAGIGVSVSTDGGATWSNTSIPLPPSFAQGAASPTTAFDNQGHVFVSFAAATFLGAQPGLTNPDFSDPNEDDSERADGLTANNGIFVARSDDGGTTWDTPTAVSSHLYDGTNPVNFDLSPDLAIDTFAKLPNGHTNPNYGNLYEVWTRIYTPGADPGEPTYMGETDGIIAVSKDHGVTWQEQKDAQGVTSIDDPLRDTTDAPPGIGIVDQVHITVGPAGDLYAAEYGGGDFSVFHSTDAGQTFEAPDYGANDRLAFGGGFSSSPFGTTLTNDQFRTYSLRDIVADPSRPGTVYAVETITDTDPSGNTVDEADVDFAKSTDYGVTFSSSFKIGSVPAQELNDDNGGVKASDGAANQVISGQAFAHMTVDSKGDIAVVWYDTRVDPANHLLDVFGTVSTDGGNTFTPNFRLTNQSFDPDEGSFTDGAGRQDFYLGDYIGLTIADGTAYAAWTDTRNGNQDIYSAQFSVAAQPAALNDRYEPNDTSSTATDLGTVFNSTIPKLDIAAGDSDWYSFSPAASGSLSIEATQTTSKSQLMKLDLYDATGGTLLATSTAMTNSSGLITGQQLSLTATSGTGYLLHVRPLKTGTTYSLQLESLTKNFGTQVFGTQSGSLALNDQDYDLLKVAAAGTLAVSLAPGSDATGTFALEIVDPTTLATLATATAGDDGVLTADLSVSKNQAVFLHISGDSTTAGSFALSFTNLDQDTAAASSTLVPAGTDPSQSVVADLTGNGKQDIVVADAGSDSISVLLSNGDGTFQAPRQYAVGPYDSTAILSSNLLPSFRRSIAVSDFNGDGIPDVVVTNYASGDVSVLLGNGDGTFQPQRRFNAVADPFDLAAGDLSGNGKTDIVTISADSSAGTNLLQENVGVLMGRGDGTFLPPRTFTITLPKGDEYPLSSVRIADLNGDGKPDLVISGGADSLVRIYLGKGDGTFDAGQTFSAGQLGTGLLVTDIDGDGKPDIIDASFGTGFALLFSGNGDGTFAPSEVASSVIAGQAPIALALADFDSFDEDSYEVGPADGHPDLIVVNSGVQLGLGDLGPADVVVIPTAYDSDGGFEGFGPAQVLYTGIAPTDVSVGDFNGDGAQDLAITDKDGIHIVYGGTPSIVDNDTPQTALDLGTVTHVEEPTLTITPSHPDAYFSLTAPTEDTAGSGDEVMDFSSFVEHAVGAGLTMQVLDASGNVIASGNRTRVDVPQGEKLTVHVSASSAGDAGAFTLDVDTLPQVVSVAAEAAFPGEAASSIVVTFQGDRLDAAAAQTASNYQVIWLGADGVAGTSDDQTVAVGSGQSVIYNPGANIDVTTGATYPTAVRQTVTLLFDQKLPEGSYEIKFSPKIVSDPINSDEASILATAASGTAAGHPLVSVSGGTISDGATVFSTKLVTAPSTTRATDFSAGSPFLAQLHSDLDAILDSQLSASGDNAGITPALIDQLTARFEPQVQSAGGDLPPLLLLFLDPVSLNLADPSGNHVAYNLQTNTVTNQSSDAFVSVAGNVEVLVMPVVAGDYNLQVSDAPSAARGGLAIVGSQNDQTLALTDAIRSGQDNFTFGLPVTTNAVTSLLGFGNDRASLVATDTGNDSLSTTEQPTSTVATTPVDNNAEANADTAVADDAVAFSNEAYTVDPTDPAQAKRRKKQQPGDQQADPQRRPASRPANEVGPTTRGVADAATPKAPPAEHPPQVPLAAPPRVVAAADPAQVVAVDLKPVHAKKGSNDAPAAHSAGLLKSRTRTGILGLIVGAALASQSWLEPIRIQIERRRRSLRRKRSA